MKTQLFEGITRHRIALAVAAGLLLLYTAAGFIVAPLVIEHLIGTRVSALLHRQVSVTDVRVNPYVLSVTLKGLSVAGRKNTPLFSARRIYLNAQLSSLFRRALVIKSVELEAPAVHVVRENKGRFNFSDLLPAGATPPDSGQSKGKAAAPLRIVLDRLQVSGGDIAFEDHTTAAAFATRWHRIRFTLEGMDTQPHAKPARFALVAAEASGARLSADGRAGAAPLSVRADIRLENLTIGKYAPYYQPFFKGRVAGGTLALTATAEWNPQARRIRAIGLTVDRLKIDKRSGDRLLAIDHLETAGGAVDFNTRTVDAGRITTRNGRVSIERTADGRIDLFDLVGGPGSKTETAADPAPAAANTGWQVSLDSFQMDGYSITATDHQPDGPARFELNHISASARGLGTREGTQGRVALKFDGFGQGTFSTQGTLSLVPLNAELKVAAERWDIRPAQVYISRFLNLTLTSGSLGTRGTLHISSRKGQAPDIRYDGQASLNDFRSVDPSDASDFVTWKSLFIKGLKVATAPPDVSIDEVSLTDFSNRVIVNPDATTNMADIFRKAPIRPSMEKPPKKAGQKMHKAKKTVDRGTAGAPAGDGSGPLAKIRITAVTLQGGRVEFQDHHIQPHVQATLTAVGGSIKGLTSLKTDKADLLLRGRTPAGIPFETSGRLNPFLKQPYLNLKMVFTGIDLSQYTPYAGKYLGYELDKGQLSLHLTYHLQNDNLIGDNRVEINQLTLGDSVKSAQATTLPVKLIIALLKDARGNINLNLPVQGNIDNPRFSLGDAILTVLRNLVVDIVKSPFKLLSSLFAGGEELQYLPFHPGQARITEAGRKKLNLLAKALKGRPALHLDIQGQADPEKDSDALREIRFDRELKMAKRKSLKSAVPLNQIVLSPKERAQMIAKRYRAATFPKPRDDQGNLKKLGTAEMEKLLLTHIDVTDNALRTLAFERADHAKENLITRGGISPGRLFVVDPAIGGKAAGKEVKPQVRFAVK